MDRTYAYKPLRFYLITNLIMWPVWLVAAYLSYAPGGGPAKLISLLEIIGLFSPLVTALWMIFSSGSHELKANFREKLFNLRSIRLLTIPAIFLIWPAVMALSVWLSHILYGEPLSQLLLVKGTPFAAGIVPAQMLLVLAPVVEEVGWKGYGMESLRGNRTFLTATIIFGALWLFWHGALFLVNNYYQNMLLRTNPLFALNFAVSMFPGAVIINWLWYKNKGNILTAILFHGVMDFQGMLQMGQTAKCIETVILIVVAAVIVITNKKIFLAKFPPKIGYFG